MTIASAFNEIAVANGGTADNSGTIAGAVDALADALAGSDVAQGATIEDGVRVLGEYISGGGGGGGDISETNWCMVADPSGFQYVSAPGTQIAINGEYIFKINDVAQTAMKVLKLNDENYNVFAIPSTATVDDNIAIETVD